MKITHATISHPGGRAINEDASGNLSISDGQSCWVVADGLGGHHGGDVAASIAVETILDAYRSSPGFSSENLGQLLELAQQGILSRQQDDGRLSAMRSTAVVLLLDDAKALWAHIGDTRLYHFSNERLCFQTRDHSVPQAMVDARDIGSEDIRHHEDRNRLTRSLGSEGKVRITMPDQHLVVAEGDAFLICTDGFWEFVTEVEMEVTLAKADNPANWLAAMEIIQLHEVQAGHDNYTATAIFLE